MLAQRQPGWKAAELKHALTASAHEAGRSVFEVGAGRLDVAAAVEQTVVSEGALDLGRSDEPSTDKVTRTLTYTATGSQDATLTVKASLHNAVTGAPAPDGAFTMPGTLSVPSGGEASMDVTLDPARLPHGSYSGTVTATDTSGRITRTAVGFVREPETTKLVVWINDHNGLPCKTYGSVDCSASSGVQAMNLDDPAHSATGTPGEPFRLRPGRYAITANVSFALNREHHVAVLALPEVQVSVNPLGIQGARMSLSAARQVRVQTDRQSEAYGGTLKFQRRVGEWSDYNAWITGYHNSSMWALPAPPPTVGQYLLTADLQQGAVPISGTVVSSSGVSGEAMKLNPRYDTYANVVPRFPASVRARLVNVGATLEPEEAAGLSGAIALARPKRIPLLDTDASFLDPEQEAALADAGAIGALVWSPDLAIGVPGTTMTARKIPVAGLPAPEGDRLAQRLADGAVTVKLVGGRQSPYLYSLKFYERDAIGSLQYRVGDGELAQIPVEHRTHGSAEPELWRYNLSMWPATGESSSITSGVLSSAPARTTELIGPVRSDQTWARWTDYDGYLLAYRLSILKAGPRPAEVTNAAPAAPGAAAAHPLLSRPCTTCRQGDTLLVRPTLALSDPALVTDPVPGSHLVGTSPTPTGLDARDVMLFEGDRQIPAEAPEHQLGRYAIPATPATLRLVYDRKDTFLPPSFRFGRAMRSEWTFRSERPASGSTCPAGTGCAVQPLLHIRYTADLNERNEAARGGSTLRLTAYREAGVPGAPLAKLSVAVSFDDGATWIDLRVSGRDDQRSVRLPAAPAEATSASLRLAASDQAGNSVRHELPNAFGLTS